MRLATMNASVPESIELGYGIELVSYNNDVSDVDCILLGGGELPDSSEIAGWLGAGKAVAVRGDDASALELLRTTTGAGVDDSAALVIYRQSDQRMIQMTALGSAHAEAPGPLSVAEETSEEHSRSSAGVTVEMAKSTLSTELLQAPAPVLRSSGDSYIPQLEGIRYGRDNLSVPISESLGKMGFDACDNHMRSRNKNQEVRGLMSVDFHAYWADGEGKPYYVLAVEQNYEFNPTLDGYTTGERVWCWDGYTKAWLMHTIEVRRLSLEASGPGTDPGSCQLLKWGPRGLNDNNEQFQVDFSMMMRRDAAGGARQKIAQTFKSDVIVNDFPRWSDLDKSDASQRTTHWSYCQRDEWNSREKPVGNFPQWWAEIYRYHPDKHNLVHDFTLQSRTTFRVRNVSVYKIPCSSSVPPDTDSAPPPPVTVRLQGGLDVHMCGFHTNEECAQNHHQMFPFGVMRGWDKTLNLGDLCRP